jgi:ribosome biogenesis protein MAK21
MKASLPKADDDDDAEGVNDDDDVDDEDDSRVDYSTQDLESDEHASSDTDTEEEEASGDAEDDIDVNWEIDGIEFSDVDGSVNPDPLRTRSKLTAYDQAQSDTQELPTVGGGKTRKRKERGGEDERTRKKKLRALPTFASYEDYARMIEDGPEENL